MSIINQYIFYLNSSLWFSKIISHTPPQQDFNFCVIRKFYGLVAGEVSGVKPYFLNFYIYFITHPPPDKGLAVPAKALLLAFNANKKDVLHFAKRPFYKFNFSPYLL